jgi:uncharacterized protein YjiS (DUF1127 family)
MPVAKDLFYTRSRSRTERPRPIDGPSSIHFSFQLDEAASARPRRASTEPRAIAVVPVAPRSVVRAVAQFAETVGEVLLTTASWLLSEILDGCAAYALPMYGLPAAISDEKARDATASKPSNPLGHPSPPTLQLISPDIGTSQIVSPPVSARFEQPTCGRSSWRTAVIAPAVLLLSKIFEGSARRQAIAELQRMDDRSLRDIGISRTDIDYVTRHGVRPE